MEHEVQSSLFMIRGDLDGEDNQCFDNLNEFIGLVVAGEEFFLDVQKIQEIIVVPNITFVPAAPELVTGVINLRGMIIPTIDLRQVFGVKSVPLTPTSRVIVSEQSGVYIGMIVDSITYVVQVRPENISNSSFSSKSGPSEFLSGICSREQHVNGIIDIEKVILKVSSGVWPDIDVAEEVEA